MFPAYPACKEAASAPGGEGRAAVRMPVPEPPDTRGASGLQARSDAQDREIRDRSAARRGLRVLRSLARRLRLFRDRYRSEVQQFLDRIPLRYVKSGALEAH